MNERSFPDWLTSTTFAHRGLHSPGPMGGVPENSLAAAKAAEMRGFGIECDIQLSADGVPFVFHDWELERLTGVAGPVQGLTGAELARLRLRGTREAPTPLQTFLNALDPATPVLIEIKSRPDIQIDAICAAISNIIADREQLLAVMSFDPAVPAWFAEHAPQICRGLVGTDTLFNGFEHVWREPDNIDLARPDFLAVDLRDLDRAEAAQWRALGKPLLSWTIRTKDEWKAAAALADAVIAEGEALA